MLTQEQVQKIKGKLEKDKEYLEGKVKELGKVTDLGDYTDSLETEAEESAQYANQLSLMQEFKKQLEEVNEALARIQGGAYGECELCKQKISSDVLEADPVSKMCKDCKSTNNK